MKPFNQKYAEQIITRDTAVFWFRRDLRLSDNAALYHALKNNESVQPVFIFDSEILALLEDKEDRRVDFIHQSITLLNNELLELGSSLLVVYGNPIELYKKWQPKSVYTNHDFESYAIQRDAAVKTILEENDIPFFTFKDHVIFEKKEITKDNGEPYTVFTPFSKKWKATLNSFYLKPYPVEKYYLNFSKADPIPLPTLADISFKKTETQFPERTIKLSVIKKYKELRDFPAIAGTSRLSVHLRFGTVSIRKLAALAKKNNETWLNELIWRDFYAMILWNFPHVENRAFKPAYDRIPWRNDSAAFDLWCQGKTGFPIVDAGMRELNATGFMHNRVRMVVASFLTKHLLVDYKWGEAYFAKKLIDFDLASNNGGWQWAAGTGCDASPYFRVFNPTLQTVRFDEKLTYVKKWVPEYDTLAYAKPIVDHAFARDRAINTFKKAIG